MIYIDRINKEKGMMIKEKKEKGKKGIGKKEKETNFMFINSPVWFYFLRHDIFLYQ